VVPVENDPHWLVGIEILSVETAEKPFDKKGKVVLLIHSPARLFSGGEDKAPGKTYLFKVSGTMRDGRPAFHSAQAEENTAIQKGAGNQKEEPVPTRPLSHASRQLLIDGWTPERVQGLHGKPKETRRTQFTAPKYGVPKALPEMDEQWYFPLEMGHRLVFFKQGKVVLAIEEWSDF
jgi:hypothetical protein